MGHTVKSLQQARLLPLHSRENQILSLPDPFNLPAGVQWLWGSRVSNTRRKHCSLFLQASLISSLLYSTPSHWTPLLPPLLPTFQGQNWGPQNQDPQTAHYARHSAPWPSSVLSSHEVSSALPPSPRLPPCSEAGLQLLQDPGSAAKLAS